MKKRRTWRKNHRLLASYLARLRKQRGWTYRQLQARVNKTQRWQISLARLWMAERRGIVSLQTLQALATAYRMRASKLLANAGW